MGSAVRMMENTNIFRMVIIFCLRARVGYCPISFLDGLAVLPLPFSCFLILAAHVSANTGCACWSLLGRCLFTLFKTHMTHDTRHTRCCSLPVLVHTFYNTHDTHDKSFLVHAAGRQRQQTVSNVARSTFVFSSWKDFLWDNNIQLTSRV